MTKKFIILPYTLSFVLLLCLTGGDAQTKIDSLLKLLANYKKQDTVKLKLLNTMVKEYQYSDISKGLQTADTAIALAQKLNDQRGLAEAYLVKGQNQHRQ